MGDAATDFIKPHRIRSCKLAKTSKSGKAPVIRPRPLGGCALTWRTIDGISFRDIFCSVLPLSLFKVGIAVPRKSSVFLSASIDISHPSIGTPGLGFEVKPMTGILQLL
jgi:hypothetical protein